MLKGFFKGWSAEQWVDAEEVGVKGGSEDRLLDADFGEDREEFGGEAGVVMKEHEPSMSVCLSYTWCYIWTYQLYDGILDPTPNVKCLIVLYGSYVEPPSLPPSPVPSPLPSSLSFDFTGSNGNHNCAHKSHRDKSPLNYTAAFYMVSTAAPMNMLPLTFSPVQLVWPRATIKRAQGLLSRRPTMWLIPTGVGSGEWDGRTRR